jgi:short-subunit dehydrogenase
MNSTTGTVLILGATSDIARAIARAYAKAGCGIILASRDSARLEADARDLALRYGVTARIAEFDVLDTGHHGEFLDRLGALPETVICVVGFMGDQAESQISAAAAELVMRSNYVGPAAILAFVANRMETRGHGTIIGVSSVSGERGRASNYVYGSSKAGFTAFLSGLRSRLARSHVAVITVKPGFVATSKTAGLDLPKALTARPEEVARAVLAAQQKGRDVVYVRLVWRPIMLLIRALPERIFKKTRF